jgi:hypothetical protein
MMNKFIKKIAESNDVNFTIAKVNTVAHPELEKSTSKGGSQHCFNFAVEVFQNVKQVHSPTLS